MNTLPTEVWRYRADEYRVITSKMFPIESVQDVSNADDSDLMNQGIHFSNLLGGEIFVFR